MALSKKAKVPIIIGLVLALGVVAYFLFFKKSNTNTAISQPSGNEWDAEDEALYNKYRSKIGSATSWVDPLHEERYSSMNAQEHEKINGINSLSGTFYQTLCNVAPNPKGTHPSVHWDKSQPSLWAPSMFDAFYGELMALKSKYFKLK